MKCPTCNIALTMTERSGIEIDYCPQCRGVWLDRGELDKIIERSASSQPKERDDKSEKPYPEKKEYYNKNNQYGNEKNYRPKKRDSFLGDMFDF